MWCITIRFYFYMYIDDKCIRVEMTGTHWQCFLWEKSKLTWSYNNLKMSACPFPCFSFFRAVALKVLKRIRSNIGVIFPSFPPLRTLTQGQGSPLRVRDFHDEAWNKTIFNQFRRSKYSLMICQRGVYYRGLLRRLIANLKMTRGTK